MRRATVTIGDDLEKSLEIYNRQQDVAPTLTALVQAALREYLASRVLVPPAKPFRITPAKKGSGKADVSMRHDEYLAER